MADIVDRATRSRMMAGIRGKDTRPEMLLRRRLHAAGLRYRRHASAMLGHPDLVFQRHKAVIFVHGCFWHRHKGCHLCSTPSSNVDFWKSKLDRNVERDAEVIRALREAGWRVAIVWECGLRGAAVDDLVDRIIDWMRNGKGDFDSGVVRSPEQGGTRRLHRPVRPSSQ